MGLHPRWESLRTPSPRFPAWLQAALGRAGEADSVCTRAHPHMRTDSHTLLLAGRGNITQGDSQLPRLPRAGQFQHREPCIPETGALGQAVCMATGTASAGSHPGSAPCSCSAWQLPSPHPAGSPIRTSLCRPQAAVAREMQVERSRAEVLPHARPHIVILSEGIPKAVTPMGFSTNSFCQQNKTNKTHEDSETSPRLKFGV